MKNYKDLLEEFEELGRLEGLHNRAEMAMIKELIKFKASKASLARIYKARGKEVEDIARELHITEADVTYFNNNRVSFEMQREEAKRNSKVLGGTFSTLYQLKDLLKDLQTSKIPSTKPEHSKIYVIHQELYEIFQQTHTERIYLSRPIEGGYGSYMLVYSKESICNIWAFYEENHLHFVVECF